MSKKLSAITEIARQFLRDEFQAEADLEFADDELHLQVARVLTEISQRQPYEVKEAITSDGTREIDLSTIAGLIGDRVVKVEYPTGNYPISEVAFTIFGNTLTLDTLPTSGETIYLYCTESHTLTESASTLNQELEDVLVSGVVAYEAQTWLNTMRSQIVPSSVQLYQSWARDQFAIYQAGLNSISRPKVWEY